MARLDGRWSTTRIQLLLLLLLSEQLLIDVVSARVADLVQDLPQLKSHTLLRLNGSVCDDLVYPPMPDAAPVEWNLPMPPGTYMLQGCFDSAPLPEPPSTSSSSGTVNVQTIIIAVLTTIFALATLAGVRFGFKFVKNAIDHRKTNDTNKRKRVRRAVRSVTSMQSACWLITLDDFRGLGKMVPHEQARDANLLKAVDEYDDLVRLVNNCPVIFFSQCVLAHFEPVAILSCSLADQ